MNNVRPRLTMMSEEQIKEAHGNVLKVGSGLFVSDGNLLPFKALRKAPFLNAKGANLANFAEYFDKFAAFACSRNSRSKSSLTL